MYLVDFHIHPYAHGENMVKPGYNLEWLQKFVNKARSSGIREVGFSDHDRFREKIDRQKLARLRDCNPDIKIRLGLEVNYLPERETALRRRFAGASFDYLIGSVHRIDDWEFDHPDYIQEYENRDIDEIYIDYYQLLKKAVCSGIFDIVGHLDLIKIYGYKPRNLILSELVEPVLMAIKEEGLTVEINTNGLNKPVQEIYPARNILRRIKELRIPITFGSDAHKPGRVGDGVADSYRLVKEMGFDEISLFSRRERNVLPL